MISNYNLDCDYHNFELKDKIYLIPESALKIIYTDGYNEAVFTGDDSNVTILEGYDISFQEESSFDERFEFVRTLSIKVDGYKTFNDLNYRYMVIIETKDGEFYIVNSDFQSFVTHTYTLTNGTNSTEFVFSSQSNIPTIKLTGFEPNVVNSCKGYSFPKVKNIFLTEYENTSLSTWNKKLINKVDLSEIKPLPDSVSLTEEFDGEKYTVTLGFDIPMRYFKNDWHIKLLQFEENKYGGYIQLEDGKIVFVGYNTGLFPSYTINGDLISVRLTETSIRGISYGGDYRIVEPIYRWVQTDNKICIFNHSFDGKIKLVLTDSSGITKACDSTSVISRDDFSDYVDTVTSVIIGNCVTQIQSSTFSHCENLSSITISDSVTDIGIQTFNTSKKLVSVNIPSGVTTIGEGAFYWCVKLRKVYLENGLITIGNNAFEDCWALKTINIPDTVTSIGIGAFKACNSLIRINIPDSVTTINNSAFEHDENMTDVVIGRGVTSIGYYAFRDCLRLVSVTILATTPPTLYEDAFDNVNECMFYVPSGSVDAYKTAWSSHADRIRAIP